MANGKGTDAVTGRCLIATGTMPPNHSHTHTNTHNGMHEHISLVACRHFVQHARWWRKRKLVASQWVDLHSFWSKGNRKGIAAVLELEQQIPPSRLIPLTYWFRCHCCVRISAYEIKCCQHIAVTTILGHGQLAFNVKRFCPSFCGRVYLELMVRASRGIVRNLFEWLDGQVALWLLKPSVKLPNFFKNQHWPTSK